MAGSHSTSTPLATFTIVESDERRREEREEKILLSVGVRVGGDEVVEDDQEEEGDAEHVGEHGELRVGDHFDLDLAPAAKGKF